MADGIGWLTARYQSPLCATETPYADQNIHLRAMSYALLSVLAVRQRVATADSTPRLVKRPHEPEEALSIQRLNKFVKAVPRGMMQ
jgi:hypothetical protein